MRQPVTPTALQPSPMHIVSPCLPHAPQRRKQPSREKAIRGKNPASSNSENKGKKIAIGGSMTDTTHAVVRTAPSTSAPRSHCGAPSVLSVAASHASARAKSAASHSEGRFAPESVR